MTRVSKTNPITTSRTDKGLRPRVPQHRIDTWHADWAEIRRLANDLHAAAEQVLAAGEQATSDGYPDSHRGQEGRGAGDHPDPTLTKVERAAGGDPDLRTPDTWQPEPDVVAQWCRELRQLTIQTRGHIRRAARLKDLIVNPRTTDTGGHCKACNRVVTGTATDRLRCQYCWACYQAWLRWSANQRANGIDDPSHIAYERWRQDQLDQPQTADA